MVTKTKRQGLMSEIERSVSGRNLGEAEAERETPPLVDEARKATSVLQNATVTEEDAMETKIATITPQRATKVAKNATKHYKNTVVSVRFDEGDYERLTAIALERGSTAASLIRAAVKELIRQGV
jgi:hypothetical protein